MNRDKGLDILSSVLKYKNSVIVEKYIHNSTKNKDEYFDLLYNCVYQLRTSKHKTQCIKDIITNIYHKQYYWNNPIYDQYKEKILEEDNFITNPFEIEEGVLECRCGSKRTISFQKQTRSADEGSTTFAQCVECGNRWRNNN
jgi:DNA-directed RNA polymerase subunit M/transcription elongation factor TFIIS